MIRLLRGYGIEADSAAGRGWRALTSGELARADFQADFRVLLTRDRRFGASAIDVLQGLPELAVVVATLPQAREATYLPAFEDARRRRPIEPVPGAIVEWP